MTSSRIAVAERWLPRAGLLSAAFTTLCCLGISAALSLATAVGATFLTQDATLNDAHATTAAGRGSGGALVWVGLAVLIAAQLWDAVRVRRCNAVEHRTPKGAL